MNKEQLFFDDLVTMATDAVDTNNNANFAETLDDYITGLVVPCIGLVGVLGNVLNLGILSWRSWRRDDDTMEKVALVGLIALAASDLCFCLTILPNFFDWRKMFVFTEPGFGLYFRAYGHYFNDIFIKISTWLTMIVATARYIAICHPLRARMCFGMAPTRWAILTTYVFWMVFLTPQLWLYKIVNYDDNNGTALYIVDVESYHENQTLNMAFNYMWAIFGYFIPVAVLAFCNVWLIRALRESQLLRETAARVGSRSSGSGSSSRRSHNRITITLVALVIAFIVLVSPSEIVEFYHQVSPEAHWTREVAVTITNLLQTINFSLTFILYCAVNVTFRRAVVSMLYSVATVCKSKGRNMRLNDSGSHRSTLLPSQIRSHETNI